MTMTAEEALAICAAKVPERKLRAEVTLVTSPIPSHGDQLRARADLLLLPPEPRHKSDREYAQSATLGEYRAYVDRSMVAYQEWHKSRDVMVKTAWPFVYQIRGESKYGFGMDTTVTSWHRVEDAPHSWEEAVAAFLKEAR